VTISSGLGSSYGLYATFIGNGIVSSSGTGPITFNFVEGGFLNLFLDPNNNTALGLPATTEGDVSRTNAGDDILIGSGIPLADFGSLDPKSFTCGINQGINCCSFGSQPSFALTEDEFAGQGLGNGNDQLSRTEVKSKVIGDVRKLDPIFYCDSVGIRGLMGRVGIRLAAANESIRQADLIGPGASVLFEGRVKWGDKKARTRRALFEAEKPYFLAALRRDAATPSKPRLIMATVVGSETVLFATNLKSTPNALVGPE
jgi:hypothetical protein